MPQRIGGAPRQLKPQVTKQAAAVRHQIRYIVGTRILYHCERIDLQTLNSLYLEMPQRTFIVTTIVISKYTNISLK